jgi:hypothetical protein
VKTFVSSKGQMVLPAEFRKLDHIERGQEFDGERLGCGDYRFVWRMPPRNAGVIDWLLDCPRRGLFKTIES